MVALIFGVWDGVFYDNRHTYEPSAPADLPLEQFSQFNPGNPIMSFVGDRGFLVMDRRANLAFSLWRYYDRAMHESCGKCIPCREGTRRMLEILERAHGACDALALACDYYCVAVLSLGISV